jgi:hypothetical protein
MSCASSDDNSLVASLVVHYTKHPELVRYDISVTGTTHTVRKSAFTTPSEFPLTIVDASLTPSPGIAAPPSVETTLSARIITPASATSASATASGAATPTPQPQADLAAALEDLPRRLVQYGRFIVAGDEQGHVHIWAWETRGRVSVPPMRSFAAADGKITAIDYYCGLVAVGR